jgi:hypothetical protein
MDNCGNHAKRQAYGYVSAMRDQTSRNYEDIERKDGRVDLSDISTPATPRGENAAMIGERERFGEMKVNLQGSYENRNRQSVSACNLALCLMVLG